MRNEYSVKIESRPVYRVYRDGELVSEHDEESEARNAIAWFERRDDLPEPKAMFHVGDRIRPRRESLHGQGGHLSDIPATVLDVFYAHGDRSEFLAMYAIQWDGGGRDQYPISALELAMEIETLSLTT
jgi:hypothetical protein